MHGWTKLTHVTDWATMFQTMCAGCDFPIEPGDRWVEAMKKNFHAECFNCSVSHFASTTSNTCTPLYSHAHPFTHMHSASHTSLPTPTLNPTDPPTQPHAPPQIFGWGVSSLTFMIQCFAEQGVPGLTLAWSWFCCILCPPVWCRR